MRLRGMNRSQQQERNAAHRRFMNSIVEECQLGNFTHLQTLVDDYALFEILHRNGATKADLKRWQDEAQDMLRNKPATRPATKKKLGVCRYCERIHPVVPNPESADGELLHGHNETDQYVMVPHRIYGDSGLWCEGKGSIPLSLRETNEVS